MIRVHGVGLYLWCTNLLPWRLRWNGIRKWRGLLKSSTVVRVRLRCSAWLAFLHYFDAVRGLESTMAPFLFFSLIYIYTLYLRLAIAIFFEEREQRGAKGSRGEHEGPHYLVQRSCNGEQN